MRLRLECLLNNTDKRKIGREERENEKGKKQVDKHIL
jgi:hypothetical protein